MLDIQIDESAVRALMLQKLEEKLQEVIKMMTTGEMLDYTERFNDILSSNLSQDFKDRMLANLMNDLERAYGISMIPRLNEKLEREHPYIMQLYRTVSDARVL